MHTEFDTALALLAFGQELGAIALNDIATDHGFIKYTIQRSIVIHERAVFGYFEHALGTPITKLLQQLEVDAVYLVFAKERNQIFMDDADVVFVDDLALLLL